MDWIRAHITKGWKYLFVCLFLAFFLVYGIIWFLIEPLGIQDKISVFGVQDVPRPFFHIFVAVLGGSLLCLGLLGISVYNKDGIARPLVDNRYSIRDANSFYNVVAPLYDARNTKSLLKTHEKVISVIKAHLRRNKHSHILDLGGGTGKLIAHHFFDNDNIRWHYVDSSSEMLKIFKENLHGTKLSAVTDLSDINSFVVENCRSGRLMENFDLILICLTLTSMEKNPDWTSLATLLKNGGKLIIADIDASYTSKYPYYIFEIEKRSYGFLPRKVPMASLLQEIGGLHLDYDQVHEIKDGIQNYSFVVEFVKT